MPAKTRIKFFIIALPLILGLYFIGRGQQPPSYIQLVTQMRTEVDEALGSHCDILELQQGIRKTYQDLIADLVARAEKKVGPAPTPYALVGLGSLGRCEASPFSDFDYAFLIKEDTQENRDYFEKLNTAIHHYVLKFNETGQGRWGIAFCKGGIIPPFLYKGKRYGSSALVDTPFHFAEWSCLGIPEHFKTAENKGKPFDIKSAALHVDLLYGDVVLLEEFQHHQRQNITPSVAFEYLKKMGGMKPVEIIKEGFFNLKKEVIRPIQVGVLFLCLFYGIEEKHPLRAIDCLVHEGILHADLGSSLKETYQLGYKVRTKGNFVYKIEIEEIFLEAALREKILDENEIEELFRGLEAVASLREVVMRL